MRRRFRGTKRIDEPRARDLDGFEGRMIRWLVQQPEWRAVLGQNRHARKRFAERVARQVTRSLR